jgi:hypothetical protein
MHQNTECRCGDFHFVKCHYPEVSEDMLSDIKQSVIMASVIMQSVS